MKRSVICTLLFAAFTRVLFTQTNTQIVGRITDSTGSVLTGAEVVVINADTRAERRTSSNELGYYTIPLLPPGNYRIGVQRSGFRPISHSGIRLDVDQAARVDFEMEVGALTERVEVTADVSAVDTQSMTLKGVVDEKRIRELPLNGRDATQLILLMPGVYGTTDTSGLRQGGSARGIVQPGFSANGARGNMVNYSLDGAYHNDSFTNVAHPFPDPDALQEFSVQTNGFSAEFGRNGGGVVNAVTRSGTNEIHGSAFEFHRNYAANARNFFSPTNDGLKRHQFGGTLGGPVLMPRLYNGRDHTFFFFSIQQTLQVQTPANNSTTVLTAPQRRGDFSARRPAITDPDTRQPFPGGLIPLSRLNVVTNNILNRLIPLPTEPDTGLLRYSVPNTQDLRQIVTKIDHNFSPKDTISGRYMYNYYHQPANDTPLIFASRNEVSTPDHNLALSHTHIFSPTTLNQIQFSLVRRTEFSDPAWTLSYRDFGVRNIAIDNSVAAKNFILGVTGAFSANAGETDTTTPNALAISETFRRTMGRHDTSFGFEFRRETLDLFFHFLIDPNISFNGNFTGYGVSDFFLGMPGQTVQSGFGQIADLSRPSYSLFANDSIRLTPRFVLNLGVRLDPYTPWVSAANRVSTFRPGSPQSVVYPKAPAGLLFPGDPGVPRGGTNGDFWNLAPRIGFAWTPFGGSRTSIRGAYGVFFDSSMMSAIHNRFSNSPPHGMRVTLAPPPGPFEDPYLGKSPFPVAFPIPSDISFPNGLVSISYPSDFKTAYIQSWHFTVEREVRSNWIARLAYAGSKGTALLQGYQRNAGIYIPGRSTRTNLASRQPFAPAFTDIAQLCFCGNSSFQSLQATLEKRFSSGFTLLANYTFAKSLDYGSGAGTLWPSFSNPFRFAHDYGRSDFYHKHRLVASGLWELPQLAGRPAPARAILGGWSLNGVMSLQSGGPFSVVAGQDNSLSGVNADRSDLVGDPSRSSRLDPNRDRVLEWFNTKAFAQNAEGTFGNTGRNILLGPSLVSVDVSLVKSFRLWERGQLQIRTEAFNLFNHTNLSNPANSLSSGTYGRITAAGDPRIMQFAAKVRF